MPSVHASLHASVHHVFNILISHLFINISSSNCTGNVYGYKNLSIQNIGLILKKQNGRHNQLFETHKDILNLEILQLA